ncbi:transporter [Tsuneonella sp. HG222]
MSSLAPRALAALSALVTALLSDPARADIPFTTDDPGVLAPGEYEAIAYSDGTLGLGQYEGELGLDFSLGVAERIQVGVALPVVRFDDEPDRFAIGDVAIGAKILLLDGGQSGVSVALAPTVNVPVGSRSRGDFGIDVPLWFGTETGKWSLYGGGGIGIASRADGGDVRFGGLVASRKLDERLSLGAELYVQEADQDGQALALAGVGLAWQFAQRLSLAVGAHAALANRRENGDGTVFVAIRLTP